MPKTTKPCSICGKPVTRHSSRMNRSKHIVCGPSNSPCFREFSRRINKARKYPSPNKLFWSRVDKRGLKECWPWLGGPDKDGYGRIKIAQKTYRAHRVSWILKNGPIPEGLCICHDCDNPPCVNPAHLYLGTDFDNIRDAVRKGRMMGPRGEGQGNSKLTMSNILEIRRRYAAGDITQRDLGIEFGVGTSNICQIIKRKTWAWLED